MNRSLQSSELFLVVENGGEQEGQFVSEEMGGTAVGIIKGLVISGNCN